MIPGERQEAVEVLVAQSGLRKVLIVDEAAPVRRKLAEILVRVGLAGEDVRAATSPTEALEHFVLEHPHVVFAEFVGEDPQSGLGMVLEMLQIDPHARIVLVTAESPESDLVRRAVRAGVFAVLPKPLRQDRVRQILAEIENEEGNIERFR